jgi:hypothetical protein
LHSLYYFEALSFMVHCIIPSQNLTEQEIRSLVVGAEAAAL